MKKSFILLCLFSLSAFLLFAACGQNQLATPDGETVGEEEELSLDKEFGGFGTNDEPVAFGEEDMLEQFPEDEEVADAFSQDPATMDLLTTDADTVKAYFLRITFGLLEGDSTATDVVDFSGSAEVSKGTLVLLKTIRFEANDAIVLPRESRQKLEFVSNIKIHFDGLALAIIDNDTTGSEVCTFTFNADGYSKTLDFSELDSLELIEPVGNGPYEVSIVSRVRNVTAFAGGFLSGQWVKTRQHGGEFRGRWINSLGTNAGFVKGIWGINRVRNKVFKGKYISMSGEFRGLLAGEWNYVRGENVGFFRGRWVNRELSTMGILRGKFKTGRENSRRGFFHGRYRLTRHLGTETDEGTNT
ncbi:hypothetical protein GWN42_09160 [candidate division KSB1 bacterium]|nr:hypothetical protein [candidate division KSB1 bacterium]